MNFKQIINSSIAKDSFWAVIGNGIGNALMLFAGIVIARLLGKDLYGEYGIVKSTMFYVASFATFGLGLTSTRFIAQSVSSNTSNIRAIVRDSLKITLIFSSSIAFLLFVSADLLASYLGDTSLSFPFRVLSVIIICRSLTTTQIGLLAGLKQFRRVAINSVLSGLFLFISCIPLTYYCSLQGALFSLLASQMFNTIINYINIRKIEKTLPNEKYINQTKQLLKFSFPVALQESSYTICNWGAVVFLTKYSSVGEVGLYSAAAQWNAIITMIPGLLGNVVLSYLAGSIRNDAKHNKTLKSMLAINFITTLIPFIIVYCLAELISDFYGPSFCELPNILRVLAFATVFETCSSVFKSEFLSMGKTWLLFTIRFIRDIVLLISIYVILVTTNGVNGAMNFSLITVAVSIAFLLVLYISYNINNNKQISNI